MKLSRLPLGGVAIVTATAACFAAFPVWIVNAADNQDNDRVLRGDKSEYIEVFKKDSSGGDKNYLYTITEFKDKWGRVCTVVTGASEETVALDCEKAGAS